MKPTWLYVKQHNITKLKYFGKTARVNPISYLGSGIYWRNHLKAHGNSITTLWCKLFDNEEELTAYATEFSIDNNIVESKDWANLMIEDGIGGGNHSEETRRKIALANRNPTEETRQKMSRAKIGKSPANKGISMSNEQRAKLSVINTGKYKDISYEQRFGPEKAKQIIQKKLGIKPWNAGKTGCFSDECNKKRSIASTGRVGPNRGKVFSDEVRRRMSVSMKGKAKS